MLCFLVISGIRVNSETYAPIYLCLGDNLAFRYTDKEPPPDTSIAWKWDIQGGTISSSNARQTPFVDYNTVGVFYTFAEATFKNGSIQKDTFIIHVMAPIPAFYFPTDTGYCSGTQFSLTLNTIIFPNVVYNWSTGEKTPSILITTPGNYSVNLKIQGTYKTCSDVNKNITVNQYPTPTVSLGADKTMCQNQSLILDAKGSAGYKYLWKPNGEVTRTITATLPGIYTVEVTNSDNCKATDDIELIDSCPHIVYIPDAVSPNADLLNDAFVKVWNFTPKDYTFSIYDRWGELIFETTDINAGWNCKVNDELVQQDIYVYKITYVDTDKKYYQLRGTFFVVR